MKKSIPPKNAKCPMCGNVPDPEDFGRNWNPFVWNAMMEMHICAHCNMELAIEFYEDESSYFERASRMLGVEVLECKKRYLEDIVNCTISAVAKESSKKVVASLLGRIEKCKNQIAAIEQFLDAKGLAADQGVLCIAEKRLQEALSEPAFGLEVALPDLIVEEFE